MAVVAVSDIEEKLSKSLKATHIEVKDFSDGCGQKFEVLVVSELFKDKTLIERHRSVNECLADIISRIHAISIKTYTPEQWEHKKTVN